MSERPPRPKKVEAFAQTDLSGEKLNPLPKLEVVQNSASIEPVEILGKEVPFIETERTLGRLNSAPDSLAEFRSNLVECLIS